MKKILILTSYITGYGHKSITNSLEEELKKRPNIDYKIVEGFELGGKFGIFIAKTYMPMVRKSKSLWKMTFKVSEKTNHSTNNFITRLIEKRFNKLLDEYDPDLIITVHAIFNTSLNSILEKRKKKIPLVVVFADLISISKLWINEQASLSISPTEEALKYIKIEDFNMNKVKIIKLPIKKEVANFASNIDTIDEQEIINKKDINFLIMSGGEGAGNFNSILELLLKLPNSNISIITGTNKKLKNKIEKNYKQYLDRIKVYGYVENIGEIMSKNDIGIVRGSPNVLMECISCLLPVIINGVLPGQEEGNVEFVLSNGFGMLLHNENELLDIINELLKDNKKKILDIKKKEFEYRDLKSSEKIINEVKTLLKKDTEYV